MTTEERIDRLERAMVELDNRSQTMTGRVGWGAAGQRSMSCSSWRPLERPRTVAENGPTSEERLGRVERALEPQRIDAYGSIVMRPKPLDPQTWRDRNIIRQQERLERNRQLAEEERAREKAEAAAELERRHQLWRDNAEARERALAELPALNEKIDKLRRYQRQMTDRRGDLMAIVNLGKRPT